MTRVTTFACSRIAGMHQIKLRAKGKFMNNKFDGHRAWAKVLWLVILAQTTLSNANDFRLGPLVDLSDPDAFAGCGSNGAEKETSVAASPTNPKNLVATWIGGSFKGIGGAISVDGGRRWQQV